MPRGIKFLKPGSVQNFAARLRLGANSLTATPRAMRVPAPSPSPPTSSICTQAQGVGLGICTEITEGRGLGICTRAEGRGAWRFGSFVNLQASPKNLCLRPSSVDPIRTSIRTQAPGCILNATAANHVGWQANAPFCRRRLHHFRDTTLSCWPLPVTNAQV